MINKYGFRLLESVEISEQNGILHLYEYEKNGAKLAWMEREEENKTFMIGFRTVPKDDTGVFHIIEHSVLSGSENYPLKEPFVELMKGSLHTFLNAMTGPENTVYPVSSKNSSDFLNLIQVYLDAVFYPLIYQRPEIFHQEGWHYEKDEDNLSIHRNGVVLNEMKGEYSSQETMLTAELKKALYSDVELRFDSGGNPESISDLTYEQFLETHKEYYHPSNSYIILDGSVNLDQILCQLDQVLQKFERRETQPAPCIQQKVSYREIHKEYGVSNEESLSQKTTFAFGYLVDSKLSLVEREGLSIIMDAISSAYEVPLRMAILDKNLGEDIAITVSEQNTQQYISIEVFNSEKEHKDEIRNTINEVMSKLAREGIDRRLVEASINNKEFQLREQDYGTFPDGIVNGMNIIDGWIQYQDPGKYLRYEEVFRQLRENLTTKFYEGLLESQVVNNKNQVLVVMVPSNIVEEKKHQAEKKELLQKWSEMNESEKQAVLEVENKLLAYQKKENTVEEIKKIPSIRVDEINRKCPVYSFDKEANQGIMVLKSHEYTRGLLYVDLHFNISMLSEKELFLVPLLCELLGEARTKSHESYELQNWIKTHLGSLYAYPKTTGLPSDTEKCNAYLVLSAGMMSKEAPVYLKIAKEVLTETCFDNIEYIANVLFQRKSMFEQNMVANGNLYAQKRIASQASVSGILSERMSGYEQYIWTKEQLRELEGNQDDILDRLNNLLLKIVHHGKIVVEVIGESQIDWIGQISEMFGTERMEEQGIVAEKNKKRNEAILIPAKNGFVYRGWNMSDLNIPYKGYYLPAAKIYSLDYLWQEVRGTGGAYGTGLSVVPYGMIGGNSYRDPNPLRTREILKNGSEYLLQKLQNKQIDLSKYIIGAIADQDGVMTSHAKGRYGMDLFLAKMDFTNIQVAREEILNTTENDIKQFTHILSQIWENASSCIVADETIISQLKDEDIEILRL